MRTHSLRPNLVLALAFLLAILLFLFGLAFSHSHFWGRYLLPILVVFLWGSHDTWRRDIYVVTAAACAMVLATFWLGDGKNAADFLVNHLLPVLILWGAAWLLAQHRQLQEGLEAQRRQLLDQQQKLAAEVAARTAELEASERQYRLLAENAGDQIWTVDMDGRFTYSSPSSQRVRGVTREEELASTWFDRMPPEAATRAAAAIQADLAALRAGLPIDETPHRAPAYRKDGTLMWSETVMSPLYDEDGKPLGLCGTTRDITERKQAEVRLYEANQRLQLATAAAGIGIWTMILSDNALEWDDRMCELHAVTPEERRAGISYDLWRARVHPDDLALVDPGRAIPPALTANGRVLIASCCRAGLCATSRPMRWWSATLAAARAASSASTATSRTRSTTSSSSKTATPCSSSV
ncbi:MAG: PAS domain S-box protein [Caldilineaceae bacterium]